MLETISHYAAYLEHARLLSYPVSLFLGFLAGMGAVTCFLPIVPALIGFIGGHEITNRRRFSIPFFIMLGSIIILAAFGVTVSFAGLTFQKYLGPYWHYLVGAACISAGLFIWGVVIRPAGRMPAVADTA